MIKRYYICAPEFLIKPTMEILGLFECDCLAQVLFVNKSICVDDIFVIEHILAANNPERKFIETRVYYNRQERRNIKPILDTTTFPAGEQERYIKRLVCMNVLETMQEITGRKPSEWGILRGVRPTKLVHRLLDAGLDEQSIFQSLQENYAVCPEKTKLLYRIAQKQRAFIPKRADMPSKEISVYIGIPYCPSRCLYCSFPGYVLPAREQVVSFLTAIELDMQHVVELVKTYDLSVRNVYIGGGTPTSLQANEFARLLKAVEQAFVSDNTEFTVEAGRPDSLDEAKIEELCSSKVNRISINPQSMQDKTLQRIGRNHTTQEIKNIFTAFRKKRDFIINMDVIAGLPGEMPADMSDTMQQIFDLDPDNLTVHTLALKRGARLREALPDNKDLPSEANTKTMLKISEEYVRKMHMEPYYLYRQKYMTANMENVGYSKPGAECIYNIQIMEERQTIIGIGPAATTKAVNSSDWSLESFYFPKDVSTYVNNLNKYLLQRDSLLKKLYAAKREE